MNDTDMTWHDIASQTLKKALLWNFLDRTIMIAGPHNLP